MLDSECVKQCGLKAMYLIACHSDASVYSLTNSPEWLHGGLWYFQLPQLLALANSMNVLDRIVVVGYDKSFEDDVIIALNGQEVMSLALFHEINFEGVQEHTEGGKSDVRCNNINVTYGYAKQGFHSQANKDGLHSPLILNNTKSKPLIGKQYLASSNFVAEFDPHEKHYDCSSNLFHARNKYPQFALDTTGHPSPDGAINILENFSEKRNTLDLTHLTENKHEAPCFPH
jgi:hypothetical protein